MPKHLHCNTSIVVVIDRASKMARLATVTDSINDHGIVQLFIDQVFPPIWLACAIVSYRNSRFTSKF